MHSLASLSICMPMPLLFLDSFTKHSLTLDSKILDHDTIRDWRIMLDIKPNSAFLSAPNSAQQVVNFAQYSAEILLWLLMLSRHFPTHATRKYLGTIQHSRYEDQVGQFCRNDATHSLGPSN